MAAKLTVRNIAAELNVEPHIVLNSLKAVGVNLKGVNAVVPKKSVDALKKQIKEDASRREEKKTRNEEKRQTGEKKLIDFEENTTIKEFAESMGVPPNSVLADLIGLGVMATINQVIDFDAAEIVADKYGYEIKVHTLEEEAEEAEEAEAEADLQPRAPIVTIMGHVDHGKTTLLDTIRETSVAAKEAGGITQHIGAYQVKTERGAITFIDTPGHEAFSQMRARGAQVTDIVILVVAANDGVMPQTIEAINHAKDAGVPVVVAVNKIDIDGADPERVKQELVKYELIPEAWGGDTIFVEISAKENIGIDNLLEMVLLVAEMHNLKANPERRGVGLVVEAKLDAGRGPVATVIIQKGKARMGDSFVCGSQYGKIRAMLDAMGKKISLAGPSTPAEILGFDGTPNAGDTFVIVESEREARQIATTRKAKLRLSNLGASRKVTLEDLHQQISEGVMKELKVILKADVMGSVQAVKEALEKIENPEVAVKVIHGSAGAINEADVSLAAAANAIVLGFSVRATDKAQALAAHEMIDLRTYSIIYHLISDITTAMEGMLEPVFKEKILGKADVKKTFGVPKVGTIAGCLVQSGSITRNSDARLIRDNIVIYTGKVCSLNRFKDAATEVQSGYECGIGLDYQDIKEGDAIETFELEEVARGTEGSSKKEN